MAKAMISVWLLIACLFNFACVSQTKYASVQDELSNSRKEVARLQAEKKQLAAQRAQLEKEIKQLQESNQRLSKDIGKISKRAQLQEKVIHLLDDTQKTIESSLKEQLAAQEIEIVELHDEVKVVLLDRILYEPGSLDIQPKGKILLAALADTVRANKNQQLVVAGHSDNVPISGKLRQKYPSNWELSAARAAAVVRYLQHQCKLDPKRLHLRAYSQYRPSASNKTEKGRRLNRRIEIILKSTGS